jgi:large subunit ribosomal protein L19
VFPQPASELNVCKHPLDTVNQAQIAILDPTGERTRLFDQTLESSAKLLDILQVRFKNANPFAGVLMSIRKRGVDTSILLRNTLLRTGVEMWVRIYSPNVEGIDIVQKTAKRARRARLTYLRKPEHDIGSVEKLVLQFQKRGRTLVSDKQKSDKKKTAKAKAN